MGDFRDVDKVRFFSAGAVAYSGLTAVLYPLHVRKVLAQAAEPPPEPTPYFRGVGVVTAGALPARVGYVLALEAAYGGVSARLLAAGWSPEAAAGVGGACGGVSGALVSACVYTPFDVISQRLIVAPAQPRPTAVAVVTALRREAGLAAFYRGMGVSLLSYAPSSGVWWGTYQSTRPHGTIVAGLTAGVVTSVVQSPFDFVKVRQQIDTAHGAADMWATARRLLHTEGLPGFWRGWPWKCFHTCLWGTTMVTAYEHLKRFATVRAAP